MCLTDRMMDALEAERSGRLCQTNANTSGLANEGICQAARRARHSARAASRLVLKFCRL